MLEVEVRRIGRRQELKLQGRASVNLLWERKCRAWPSVQIPCLVLGIQRGIIWLAIANALPGIGKHCVLLLSSTPSRATTTSEDPLCAPG